VNRIIGEHVDMSSEKTRVREGRMGERVGRKSKGSGAEGKPSQVKRVLISELKGV